MVSTSPNKTLVWGAALQTRVITRSQKHFDQPIDQLIERHDREKQRGQRSGGHHEQSHHGVEAEGNWRGPIWFPVNMLLIRALLNLFAFYGPSFTVECPTGSGVFMNLFDVAKEIARRLTSIFLPDAQGARPVYGGTAKFQSDPHWRDLILFYEYFHGDNGAGLGASHQTGWTGLVAMLIRVFGFLDADTFLERWGREALIYRPSAAPSTSD
jgi:hypothetical protein